MCTRQALSRRQRRSSPLMQGMARWEDGGWRLRERAQVRGARLLLARTLQRRPAPVAAAMADAA
jgi:hypothetical protein